MTSTTQPSMGVEDVDEHSVYPAATQVTDVSIEQGTWACRRGYDMFMATYTPAKVPLREAPACLVFHHGLSDHSSRHADVLKPIASAVAMPVYVYDAHGHGRSGPLNKDRALVLSPQHLVEDLLDFVQRVVVPDVERKHRKQLADAGRPAAQGDTSPRVRVFLMGYSMGGMTAALAVASSALDKAGAGQRHPVFEGLMLSSALTDPLFGDPPHLKVAKFLYVTALGYVAPRWALFPRKPVESGIRDVAAVKDMATDNYWYRGNFKVATISSLLWGCMRLRRLSSRISLPLLVQHATVDTSCSFPSMQAFLQRIKVPASDLTVRVYEGAYHDIHHDPVTPEVLKTAIEWLRPRVGPPT